MIEIKGKYGKATIYAQTIEDELIDQCKAMLNEKMTENKNIAIMPDTHVGKGCMIGATMEVGDEVCPNLVGVDLGCGMLTVNLGKEELDLDKLDEIITMYVPLGFNVHEKENQESKNFFDKNKVKAKVNYEIPKRAIGTLGGGNHFIEVDQDTEGNNYLIIHTGSRNFGKQIAEYWQDVAVDEQGKGKFIDTKELIENLKKENRHREIETELKKAKAYNKEVRENLPNKDLATLTGNNLKGYLDDSKVAQEYASLNRKTIANNIIRNYYNKNLEDFEHFETIHNYINLDDMILRKGAISAKKGEKVLIPLNMRDGSLIAIGKGNKEWNNSAPHGAGRLMSRRQARENIDLEDFKNSMNGIYSSSVNESTIDESPFAYKDAKEIMNLVGDTVDIVKHIKPIYNRKAEA